jgi:hypothetical protein
LAFVVGSTSGVFSCADYGGGARVSDYGVHIIGKRTSDEQTDVWVRATVGFAKEDGGWKATHEHFSVPFYMDGSNKAAIDLKP